MRKTLLLLLGVIAALPALARDFTYTYEGQTLTYTVIDEDAKTCETKKGTSSAAGNPISGTLVIPSIAKDGDTEYTVESIGDYAFSKCYELTTVTIPNSVTSIGWNAFYDSGLTSIEIPNSVTSIGGYAFYNTGLTSIEIPNSVTSIGSYTFYKTCLTSIEIPNSVTSIGSYTFYKTCLTSIEIPNSVTSIGSYAFFGCTDLRSVKINGLTPPIMDDTSFGNIYSTVTLSIPDGTIAKYLGTNWSLFENIKTGNETSTIYNTDNLKYRLIRSQTDDEKNMAIVISGDYSAITEITIPEGFSISDGDTNTYYYVDGIGYKAFYNCSELTSVTFDNGSTPTVIGERAFAGTNIQTITIPQTVESIGIAAFYQCKALTLVEMGNSVTSIGNWAFHSCSGLTAVTIPNSVTSIGASAFYGCSGLTSVKIGNSVTSIGNSAFADCYYLTSLTIPNSVTSIGSSAFANCYRLTSVRIPNSVTIINDQTFFWSGLTSIEIPNSVISIGNRAFEGSTLISVEIPNSVSSIGNEAFQDCVDLTSVEIPNSVTSIGNSAFAGCRTLSSIVIPGSVTTIGSNCFSNSMNHSCGLKDITFVYGPYSIAIGESAFRGLTGLTWDRPTDGMNINTSELQTLCIGNTVTELNSNLFKDAAKLTSLTLGNSITSIGDNAFSGCTELTEVILPPSVERIGTSAFEGNSKLTSIKIGHSVKSIGEKAFNGCPADEVKITAQTPPVAANNTFSNYSGKLYVQGQESADAYFKDSEWGEFDDPIVINEPTSIEMEKKSISGKPGDTFQLTATLKPENVTLPHIFWRSTNPEVATVDENGLVTLHQEMSGIMAMSENGDDAGPCRIIAESLYANGPVAEVLVNASSSDIDNIFDDNKDAGEIDYSAPYDVYNLQGMKVGATTAGLIPGIYIIRQGNVVKKIAVR